MADDSPPEKRMRYSLRSSAKASNLSDSAEKLDPKPEQPRYTLRSSTKRNANTIAIEPAEIPRKRKMRRNKSKELMELNDDCLLKMLEYMRLNDLCNLAETNKRLHGLTQYHFSLKFKELNCAKLIDGHKRFIHLEQFKRVLHIFGHHIVSLKVSTSHFPNYANISERVLSLISQYCIRNLKTLKLANFLIRRSMDARCLKIFDRIEHLVLVSGWIDWISMKSLRTLKLIEVDSHWDFVSLPKISYVIIEMLKYFATENLVEFLELNQRIESLTIEQGMKLSTDLCRAIGGMNDLQSLVLRCYGSVTSEEIFQRDLNYLSSLKKLQVLALDCVSYSASSLLAQFVTNGVGLVHLWLEYSKLDADTFENIKQLKTLKGLSLSGIDGITNFHIVDLAEELRSLEGFQIKTNINITGTAIQALVRNLHECVRMKIDTPHFELDLDTYNGMVGAIQKRSDKKHMELTICNGEQIMVPSDVINGPNKKWLQVEVNPWYRIPISAANFDSVLI